MNFTQYMGAHPGGGGRGPCPEGYLCFEDGTMMPRPPSAWDPDVRRTVAPTQVGDGTGGPQARGPATSDPSVGMDFARLLNIMRRERGVRRPPEQRTDAER